MEQENTTSRRENPLAQSANLRHYWHVVLERRWLVITAFFTILILTAIYLFRAVPIYQASVRIQIDRENNNPLNLRDQLSVETREQDYLQTQYKNLMSRTLLQAVLNKEKLDKDPRYAKRLDKVEALANDISVVPIRMSRLVDVRVEHPDRKVATRIANTLAQTFIDQNLEQKVNASFQALTWLKTQVADTRNQVERSEENLLAYRKQHNEVSLEEGENIVRQALLQAQSELGKIRAESAVAQETAAEIDRLINNGEAVETIPSIAQNPLVQRIKQEIDIERANLAAMMKKYRDKYPTVIAARSRLIELQDQLSQECDKVLQRESDVVLAHGAVMRLVRG